jgi:NDP-sugar pyrophosphorylase family protein
MKRRINHALIMAAGRGMRMMPLTAVIPKPMVPFMGGTLITEGIRTLATHIENIHVTVGYKGALLAEHVIAQGVRSVFNTEGMGNSWWIYNTLLKYLDEPIYVLTCDNIVDFDFGQIDEDYYSLGAPACMVVPVKPVAGLEGDYIFHEKNAVFKLSRTDISDSYCSGIQIINPRKINDLTEKVDDFYAVWEQLIRKRAICCSNVYPMRWFAVDTVEQLNRLLADNDSADNAG